MFDGVRSEEEKKPSEVFVSTQTDGASKQQIMKL